MAITAVAPRVVNRGEKVEISMEEFKKWLKQFDKDKDGRINVKELREAIYATGGSLSKVLQANRIMKAIDTNSNGFIDENELSKLFVFALKQFGLKIIDL